MLYPSVLEISKKAIDNNINHWRSKLKPKTMLIAIIKAFAYGSDSLLIAKQIEAKVDKYAVAYCDEGLTLREGNIKKNILVLHPQTNSFPQIIENNLEPCLYSIYSLKHFIYICKKHKTENYPIHININTGLNRLGFNLNQTNELIELIRDNKYIKVVSIFSHLIASEDSLTNNITNSQISSFNSIADKVEKGLDYKLIRHIANTSGILNHKNAEMDMVRIGIGLLGFDNYKNEGLENVCSLKTQISHIHTIKKGESVSYNGEFVAEEDTTIATLSIGHADGISRSLGNENFWFSINNQKANIIGNVCMDMTMVNITGIDCKIGDEAVFFGTQDDILTISRKIGTISYEVLTMTSQRVKRIIV